MIVLSNSWEPGRAVIKELQVSDRVEAVIVEARLAALEESTNRLLVMGHLGFVLLAVLVGERIFERMRRRP